MQELTKQTKLLNYALILSFITIGYNVIEGVISIWFGMEDATLALLGFGVDSFVEVISGFGIAHMIFRMRYTKVEAHDTFERQALRITGFSFYLLTAGLVAGAVINIFQNNHPETTMVGVIISSISILTMWWLMTAKKRVGNKLNSDAITADANCTKTCFYLSILLLASSGLYEIFQIGWIDAAGSLGIAWFAFSEGRESFQKAKSEDLSCCCGGDCHS
ncbi:MAG: cation transporter [Bacteroidales bacterium]|nr:cation transporter [Bacteroidales bacterium]MCF8333120.1 cation transporter [Bacteroidales bacterium]